MPADLPAADPAVVDPGRRAASRRSVLVAAGLDAVCVLAFVATGRSSHAQDGGVAGVLGTAWPFLVAAALGWLAVRAWRSPARLWPVGVVVWAVTWAGGLTLRGLAGGGLAPAFVVVAAVALAVLLLGWRGLATAISARARRRASGPAPRR